MRSKACQLCSSFSSYFSISFSFRPYFYMCNRVSPRFPRIPFLTIGPHFHIAKFLKLEKRFCCFCRDYLHLVSKWEEKGDLWKGKRECEGEKRRERRDEMRRKEKRREEMRRDEKRWDVDNIYTSANCWSCATSKDCLIVATLPVTPTSTLGLFINKYCDVCMLSLRYCVLAPHEANLMIAQHSRSS